jgi:hypothetical protein
MDPKELELAQQEKIPSYRFKNGVSFIVIFILIFLKMKDDISSIGIFIKFIYLMEPNTKLKIDIFYDIIRLEGFIKYLRLTKRAGSTIRNKICNICKVISLINFIYCRLLIGCQLDHNFKK